MYWVMTNALGRDTCRVAAVRGDWVGSVTARLQAKAEAVIDNLLANKKDPDEISFWNPSRPLHDRAAITNPIFWAALQNHLFCVW